jgi:ribosome biogenesis GTPase
VLAAVEAGSLAPDRLASYHKLVGEAQFASARTDARLRAEQDRKGKTIAKSAKDYHKHYDRRSGE